MNQISKEEIVRICSVPIEEFDRHKPRIPYRIVKSSEEMGDLMSGEFVSVIEENNKAGTPTRAIVPCGPSAWYEPFTRKVNEKKVSLRNLTVFHMDECLDWQGKLLPKNHPLNFRTEMEKKFYSPVLSELSVPDKNRLWMQPDTMDKYKTEFWKSPVDICLGGWGQDGHIAYNQARRGPYSPITIDDLKNAEMRIQDNNWDTILALANRNFGSAYQLVPPMSCTIGIKECLSAKQVRLFSDTGAWKQTAFRAALFGPICTEFPMTLLQEHPDAIVTATWDTADHPLSRNPEWEF
jgi:glucosamine-6-phosphate deaminase